MLGDCVTTQVLPDTLGEGARRGHDLAGGGGRDLGVEHPKQVRERAFGVMTRGDGVCAGVPTVLGGVSAVPVSVSVSIRSMSEASEDASW